MTVEQELLKDTEQLKSLITQFDKSGVSAWEAGDLLKVVKDKKGYVLKFGNFESYTKSELGINSQTANSYIVIREKFTKDEVGNLMLVSHLRVIAEIENDKMRKLVLKSFKEREENEYPKLDDGYKAKLSDIIATVTMVLDSGDTELGEKEIEHLVELNIEKGREDAQKLRRAKRKQKGISEKDLFGNQFKSEYFKDVTSLIENEPISEMGLVALFCIMFQTLRGTQFDWKKEESITFVSIKYIRSAFPDACIRAKTTGKIKRNFELNVEFEFESYNYIQHKHNRSAKTCDLIICWNDNAKTDSRLKQTQTVQNMPPVLSLKNCFETGEIELLH